MFQFNILKGIRADIAFDFSSKRASFPRNLLPPQTIASHPPLDRDMGAGASVPIRPTQYDKVIGIFILTASLFKETSSLAGAGQMSCVGHEAGTGRCGEGRRPSSRYNSRRLQRTPTLDRWRRLRKPFRSLGSLPQPDCLRDLRRSCGIRRDFQDGCRLGCFLGESRYDVKCSPTP